MKIGALLLSLLILFAFASSMSFDDAKLEADNYRDNFCAGIWPDYAHREPDCTVDEVSAERYYP